MIMKQVAKLLNLFHNRKQKQMRRVVTSWRKMHAKREIGIIYLKDVSFIQEILKNVMLI
jgi:hypothetical protein